MQPDQAVVNPTEATPAQVLAALALALAKIFPAEPSLLFTAQARMESQFADGVRRGREEGFRDGYGAGYAEGHDDGRREVLDARAAEEAERASLKASALARRSS